MTRDEKKFPVFAAVAAGALTFVLYLPSLWFDFVNWDDPAYIIDNPYIRTLNADLLVKAFATTLVGNWHPATVVSYALDYALWGLNPAGYHLTNSVLHSANAGLVALLTVRVASAVSGYGMTALASGLLSGLVFGFHPVHVESVAWVSERKDVLGALFFLLSVLSYLGYARSSSRSSYAASIGLFALGLMSKPMVVSLPLVLIVLDMYPLRRLDGGWQRRLLEKTPFFILSLFSAALTLWAQKGAMASVADIGLHGRLLTALKAYTFYMGKMIAPVGLLPLYPHPVEVRAMSAEYIFPAAVFLSITLLSVYAFRRNRAFAAVWLYYVLTLLPVSGLVQAGVQAAADRYAYLPSVAPTMLASFAAAHFCAGLKRPVHFYSASAAVFFALAVLAALASAQISVWRDSVSLWSYQIAATEGSGAAGDNPINLLPYYNRGLAFLYGGEYEKSIEDFTKVTDLNPGYKDAYVNRGTAYGITGRYGLAIRDFDKALLMDPADANALKNRALAYEGMKDKGGM